MGVYHTNTLQGTINVDGTLSNEIDVQGYTWIGLMAVTDMTAGTLSFEVADFALGNGGVYATLKNASGADVQIPGEGKFAVSGDALLVLAPYRYVRIKTSSQQTGGLLFKLPVKP